MDRRPSSLAVPATHTAPAAPTGPVTAKYLTLPDPLDILRQRLCDSDTPTSRLLLRGYLETSPGTYSTTTISTPKTLSVIPSSSHLIWPLNNFLCYFPFLRLARSWTTSRCITARLLPYSPQFRPCRTTPACVRDYSLSPVLHPIICMIAGGSVSLCF